MKIPLTLKLWALTIAIFFWPWVPLLIFRSQLQSNPFAFAVWIFYIILGAPKVTRLLERRYFPEASKK